MNKLNINFNDWEEIKSYDIIISKVDRYLLLNTVLFIRKITDLGLKDSKNIVDSIITGTPYKIKNIQYFNINKITKRLNELNIKYNLIQN
jgi:ribosomal protein L7/L12